MNLVKLNSNIIEQNKKSIYIYELSSSYLRELQSFSAEFCLGIAGIFDDYKRAQDVSTILHREVGILPTKSINNIDWNNALLIITSDYYNEAYEKIQNICEEASLVDVSFSCPETVYYYVNKETEIDLSYREKYKDSELENIIVFRSGPHASSYVRGTDFADNSRALFEYMINNGYNEKYELIWFVKYPNEFERYAGYKNVSFISFDYATTDDIEKRDEYYRALCLAKWIFMTDAYGFCRNSRPDQVRVQLWHGCGFKTRTNFVPCEKRYEYNIVIGELYKRIHADIYGLRSEQVLITGYPKVDWLFTKPQKEKVDKLGIPKAKKYIFWLPTFRTAKTAVSELNENTLLSQTGLPIVIDKEKLELINNTLIEMDIAMIIKLHPFQNRDSIVCDNMSNIVLLDNEQLVDCDMQINELLPMADALISDYSSVAVDYLILNKPIAFTLDDVREYEDSRGFVFDNIREYLPGSEIFSIDDFIGYIKDIAGGIDSDCDKRNRIRDLFHQYKDGNSCRRVLDALLI